MSVENIQMDEKATSALKSLMTFGLYGAVVAVGAAGGMMALLLAA